jgi:antitoxin component HigA of HigAB toxin-antitoxin module
MTPTEYQTALRRAEVLMEKDPEPESVQGRELLALVDAIEAYEDRIYPMARVLPVLTAETTK